MRLEGWSRVQLSILLVDDSEDVRGAMRSVIEQNPKLAVCGEADSGSSAVTMVEQLRPDMVILDYSMPIKNGLETALEISSIAPEMPLVMCTLYGSELLRQQALGSGIKAIVSKDENLAAELLNTINSIAHF